MTRLEQQLRELVERGAMYASTRDLAVLFDASEASVLRVMHKLDAEGLVGRIEGEAGHRRGQGARGRQPKIFYWATM